MSEDLELIPVGKAPSKSTGATGNLELQPLKYTPPEIIDAPANLPEITAQKTVPWYDRLGTDFKLMATSEPWEKARIIASSFPDRVELFQDTKTKEPIISLDGKQFVVNKEGLSAQDLNDFVAETGSYLIPSILSGGAGFLARLGLGALTYGTAEAGRELATTAFGGKAPHESPIDVQDVGAVSAIGATTEAVLPPVLKLGKRGLQKIWSGVTQSQSPQRLQAIVAAAASGDENALQKVLQANRSGGGNIPLTRGQQTGSRADLETEAMMREGSGSYGVRATDVMRGFDENQMVAIEREAQKLQERVGRGSGFAPDTPYNIGTQIQDDLIKAEAIEGSSAAAAMTAKRQAIRENPAFITGGTLLKGIESILAIPGERGLRTEMLNMMPHAKQVMGRLRRTRKNLKEGRMSRADYAVVDDFRRSLQTRINSLKGPDSGEEQALLIEMKSRLDLSIDDAITKGLIHGDPNTLAIVKQGNKAWAEYQRKFFPRPKDRFGAPDLAGKKLGQILGGESPENVVSFFVNVTKAGPKKETVELFKRVQNIFGKDSEQIALIKDAAIYRMFTNANMKGKADVTRTAIVKNYFDFFEKNKSLANVMFTAREREAVRKFVGQVARTIPAETKMNPSGSGHLIARLFRDLGSGGLLARITAMGKGLPIVGDAGGAGYAKTLAYANRLTSAPLGATVTAATDKDRNSFAQDRVRKAVSAVNSLLP
tara:strand:+ start:2879 stop:5017 length:2139 start_codon:yes stop_codon:yes gene_type:complete